MRALQTISILTVLATAACDSAPPIYEVQQAEEPDLTTGVGCSNQTQIQNLLLQIQQAQNTLAADQQRLARLEQAYQQGAVSEQSVRQAALQVELDQANLDNLQGQLQSARGVCANDACQQAMGALASAQAQLSAARAQLAYDTQRADALNQLCALGAVPQPTCDAANLAVKNDQLAVQIAQNNFTAADEAFSAACPEIG
jgi:hypothetical protein